MLKSTRNLFSILLILSIVSVNAYKDNTETSATAGFPIECNNSRGESMIEKSLHDEEFESVQEDDSWCENERLEIADEIDYLSAYMKEVADDLAKDGVRIAVEERKREGEDVVTWMNENVPCNYSESRVSYLESTFLPQHQV